MQLSPAANRIGRIIYTKQWRAAQGALGDAPPVVIVKVGNARRAAVGLVRRRWATRAERLLQACACAGVSSGMTDRVGRP